MPWTCVLHEKEASTLGISVAKEAAASIMGGRWQGIPRIHAQYDCLPCLLDEKRDAVSG